MGRTRKTLHTRHLVLIISIHIHLRLVRLPTCKWCTHSFLSLHSTGIGIRKLLIRSSGFRWHLRRLLQLVVASTICTYSIKIIFLFSFFAFRLLLLLLLILLIDDLGRISLWLHLLRLCLLRLALILRREWTLIILWDELLLL